MTTDLETRLIEAALAVRGQAYARYSRFAVGAALATADGQIFTGVNVENASYGLTICAERSAVFAAVAAGCRKFALLALASEGGVTPCGACRQVLAEFCEDLPIVLVDALGHQPQQRMQLAQLLPGRFSL